MTYFRQVLGADLELDPKGKRVLDVGCGGGLLAEEFVQLGFEVSGIDPSAASLATARAHAEQHQLVVDYRLGTGEAIPFPDATFDQYLQRYVAGSSALMR